MIGLRRMGRLAAAAATGAVVIAATGVAVAGSAPGPVAGGTRRASASLAYTCRFPSGAHRVGVRVAAGFPVTGTVGRAIQPTGADTRITVPQAAVHDLGRLRATTVRATSNLRVTVAEGRTSVSAAWRGRAARSTPLPTTGNLVLTASGPVPQATASVPGQVTFTADGMHLVLSPRTANGAATSPAALAIPCRLNPGQDAQIAVVTVVGPSPLPVPSHLPGLGRHHSITVGRIGAASHPSKKCFLRVPLSGIGSAFVAGYADASKLSEAALLGPGPNDHPRAGLTDIRNAEIVTDICVNPAIVYQIAIGELNYHGRRQFPPARATFLNFRFAPVTATLVVSLVQSDCRDVSGHLVAKTGLCIVVKEPTNTTKYITTITSEERIRVSSLMVNGVPLPAGKNCQTATATKVTFRGSTKQHYSLLTGGPLQGFVTIPQFTGCGVGENLDPLLNASVAGSGNYALLTQGPLCEKFPHLPANHNCRIPPGAPGYPYGLPKYYPKLRRHV
jgi:uncharacterized protein DUF6801